MVEQGTHKPLVGSSTLPPGTNSFSPMSAWVYILRGSNGRHYIGSTTDLTRRISEHKRGHTYTTKRLGDNMDLQASKKFETLEDARLMEKLLKSKKNPKLAIYHLQQG